MPPGFEQDDSGTPVVVGRRSARLSMIVPITIKGTDATGQAFRENTWTIGVNKHGARLATFHPLAVGDQIVVENPVLGRTAKCHVIRVCEKRFPEDPFEIGIELLEAQNVWGVKFPPEDWQKPAASSAPFRSGEASGRILPRKERPIAEAPPATMPAEIPVPPTPEAKPAQPAEHPEQFNQLNLAVTGLSRFAQEAHETAELMPGAKPTESPLAPETQSHASLQKAIHSLEEKVSMVQALEQQLTLLAGRLQSSRSEFEGLLSKAREVQQGWHLEIQNVQRNIQSAGREVLKSAADELSLGLHQELQSASTAFVVHLRKKVEEETAKAIEAVRKEAGARQGAQSPGNAIGFTQENEKPLSPGTRSSQEIPESVAGAFKQNLSELSEEMAASFRAELKRSIEESIGESIPRLTQDFEEKLKAASQNENGAFREALQTAREGIQAEIADAGHKVRMYYEAAVEAAKSAASQETESANQSIRRTAKEELVRFLSALRASDAESEENFRKQLADLLTSAQEAFRQTAEAEVQELRAEFSERLKSLSQERENEISDHLRKTANELSEASDQALRQRVAHALEDFSGGLESAQSSIIGSTKQELEKAIQTSSFNLRQEAEAMVNDLKSLGEGLNAAGQEAVNESQRRLQGISALLDKEIAGSAERALANLQTGSVKLVKDTSDALTRQVGLAAMVTKDWAEQARALLDQKFQQSMQVFEAWIEGQTRASQEQLARESRAALSGLRARIIRASSVLESAAPEEAPQKHEAAPPVTPPQPSQTAESLPEEIDNPVAIQVRAKQQQAVNEAVESFRKKIAESLATFPLSTKSQSKTQTVTSEDSGENS